MRMRNRQVTKISKQKMRNKRRQNRDLWLLLVPTFALAVGMMIYRVSVTRKPPVETASRSVAHPTASAEVQPPVPAYYASASAAQPYPTLIPATNFRRYPLVERAYQDAAEVPGVFAQQPCYCHCDKSAGHHSLLDCYASDHAAGCLICIKEALLVEQMTQRGKSPAEIRQAIIRGEWQIVDLRAASR